MPAIISGDRKRVGSAIDPKTSNVPASCFTSPTLVTGCGPDGRALSNQQQRGHLSCQQCETSTRPCQATTQTHETTVSASFVLFARQDGRFPTPDLDSTSCLKPSRFSYRKYERKKLWKFARNINGKTRPPKSVFCEPQSGQRLGQRSSSFVGATNSSFRSLK
jgi:hypothetical protein